jgi:hypothetical protein
MKKIHKGFIVFYLIWAVMNVTFLILAMSDVFGISNSTSTEFWPFTIGAPRYYDFYELLVYLLYPLLIYFVYRQGQSKKFWISYIVWGNINLGLMIMAISDVFGTSNRNVKEFWPFTVGAIKYYDLLELVVYLTIPLIVYYFICLGKKEQQYHEK